SGAIVLGNFFLLTLAVLIYSLVKPTLTPFFDGALSLPYLILFACSALNFNLKSSINFLYYSSVYLEGIRASYPLALTFTSALGS
ncbi:MAG: hypothetical protein ACKO96_14490, partial [Flammeovirgaceae bacterium]